MIRYKAGDVFQDLEGHLYLLNQGLNFGDYILADYFDPLDGAPKIEAGQDLPVLTLVPPAPETQRASRTRASSQGSC